jgi:hypothetical protein
MQGVRLIVESVAFATTLVSLTYLLREAAGGCLNKKVAVERGAETRFSTYFI